MAAAIGEVLSLSFYTFDSAGVASNATTVVCTITLPDGTTSTPSVTNSATGTYTVTFTAASAGLHGVKWVATGDNASAKEDAFQVDPVWFPVVSLSELRDYLQMSGTDLDRDAELTQFAQAAQSAIEARVGALSRRTVTETYSGDGSPFVVLRSDAVVSVSSVTESGTALLASDYSCSTAGVLTRVSGYSASAWSSGVGNIEVQYVQGRTVVPADLRQAVLVLTKHLWDTQRGNMGRGPRSGEDYQPGVGFTFPNRVNELVAPYLSPGIA